MQRVLAVELPKFLLQHPKLRVQVIITNRRIDLIEEGVDIAVRVREKLDTDAEFQVRILGRGNASLFASPAFLAERVHPKTPADLPNYPTLGHTERAGFDRWPLRDAHGNEEIIAHQPRLAATQFDVLAQAAIEGVGIALLPDSLAARAVAHGKLERVLPEWSTPEGIIHFVFTSRRGLLPSVRAVIEFLAEILHPTHPEWR
jgi:DNA-binding transcriptional LysR family regulator